MMNPLLKALHDLGGSALVPELEESVSTIMNLTNEQLEEIHRGNLTAFRYRLAWTRNYLKRFTEFIINGLKVLLITVS